MKRSIIDFSLGIGLGLALGFSMSVGMKRQLSDSLRQTDECREIIQTQRGLIGIHETNHLNMVKLLSESSPREADLNAMWQDCMEQSIRYWHQLHGNPVP